jgi:hypothetical protein
MEHDNGKSGIDITGLLNAGIASNTINSDELLVELKKIKDKEINIAIVGFFLLVMLLSILMWRKI